MGGISTYGEGSGSIFFVPDLFDTIAEQGNCSHWLSFVEYCMILILVLWFCTEAVNNAVTLSQYCKNRLLEFWWTKDTIRVILICHIITQVLRKFQNLVSFRISWSNSVIKTQWRVKLNWCFQFTVTSSICMILRCFDTFL